MNEERSASGKSGPMDPYFDPAEDGRETSLRPHVLSEFQGQARIKENLSIFISAAKERSEPLDHLFLMGPPGLGKTTLALVVASEMGVDFKPTSAPAIEKPKDLAGILTTMRPGSVLFIDEIHRLVPVVEEYLYPAMEDYRIEIPVGEGPAAQLIHMTLPRFTLVGATTRTGLLTSPLRDRFGIVLRLDYYSPVELAEIARRSALRLHVPISDAACHTIGQRARGTPRIANRLLRRVRDFAEVEQNGFIDEPHCGKWLDRLGVDKLGLDDMDRALLRTVIERFDGGPVGIESLAAAVSEESDTLEDVYEPYLIQEGFLTRTPRGRVATRRAYQHLGLPDPVTPPASQQRLF